MLNVGDDQPSCFLELAETRYPRRRHAARWEFAPFTAERAAQEPGDFYSDISRIRALVGWAPRTSLDEGVRASLDYYRATEAHYWS